MLSALTGAFAASADTPLQAALGAVVSMGVAGELAACRMQEGDGNGSFRTYLKKKMKYHFYFKIATTVLKKLK